MIIHTINSEKLQSCILYRSISMPQKATAAHFHILNLLQDFFQAKVSMSIESSMHE